MPGLETAPVGPVRTPPPPLKKGERERNVAVNKEGWRRHERVHPDHEKLILDGLGHSAADLEQEGIYTDEETGRYRIQRSAYLTPQAKQDIEAFVARKEQEIAQKTVSAEEEERDDWAVVLEKIVDLVFAKCLPEYDIWISSRFSDFCGQDIYFKNRETGQVEFVVDVTLGKSDPVRPVNQEKVTEVRGKIINGVIAYDGYGYNDKKYGGKKDKDEAYIPIASLMTPLLVVSLPAKTPDNKNNLERILNRMSLPTEGPTEKEFLYATYMTQQMLKSMNEANLNLRDIYEESRFNVNEIQDRARELYSRLTPAERAKWSSVKGEVGLAINEWPKRIESLEDLLWEIEAKLGELAGLSESDLNALWNMKLEDIEDTS